MDLDTYSFEDWPRLTIEISPDVIFQDLDGETVLLDMKTGQYYGLDEVSTRIWQLVNTSSSLEGILSTLQDEYAVEVSKCRQEMCLFLQKLEKKHLISVQDTDRKKGTKRDGILFS